MQIPAVTIAHKNFSITVPEMAAEPGEIVGMFGKSGAGKTSYLKRVRELFDPREVHYMSQFDGLLEEITVRQNIELGLAAAGKTMADMRDWEKQHASLLRDFEVDRHLSKMPRALSGGQRKRAEIVRALIMNPRMLLLDEPFQGIGHLFEAVCTREIIARGERKEGATLIVSHDFDLLCTFSTRILLVDDRGVIGFVPTREPGWHPQDVRTAWTLGVENVLSSRIARSLDATGLPKIADTHSVGFWGWCAEWNALSSTTITIEKESIRSMRSALKQGTLYTRVEVRVAEEQEPVVLVGKGTVNTERDRVTLGVHDAWELHA